MRLYIHNTVLSIVLLGIILLSTSSAQKKKPTRNVEITAEQEKIRDPEGFAAIKELHHLMDDDHSGSIDRFESADFLAEDLKIGGSDRARREKAFHHNNDDSITVDDMWEAWFQSEIRDWDENEVAEWLKNAVKLPQYTSNFLSNHVNGIMLPRMATQNSTLGFIQSLGIKNFVHRQKLQLKALDLVLFGFQDLGSPWKDIALGVSLVGLVTLLIIFKVHKSRSKREMEELSSRFSELKNMENDFEGAQQKLAEDRQRRQSTVDAENKHIEALKNQLLEAEKRIEMSGNLDSLTYALQPLLRRCYDLESSYINQQKLECLAEMREATEFVDKLRKKQGLMNSFKLATGTNAGTDDIDNKIFNLKSRMEKIKLSMDECAGRWIEIESLCGFSIVGSFGVHHPLPAGLAAPIPTTLANGGDSHVLAQKAAMLVNSSHIPRGYVAGVPPSAIPPSVQLTLYDELNSPNSSHVGSSKSSVANSYHYVPSNTTEGATIISSPSISKSEAAVNTRDAKKNSNEDSTSLSSSNSKSVPSRRSNKITDLIKRKVKRDRAD